MKTTEVALPHRIVRLLEGADTSRGRVYVDAFDATRLTSDWRDAILPYAAKMGEDTIRLGGVFPANLNFSIEHKRWRAGGGIERDWTGIFWSKLDRAMTLIAIGRLRTDEETLLVTWTPNERSPGVWMLQERAVRMIAELPSHVDEDKSEQIRQDAELNRQMIERAWERLNSEAVDLDEQATNEIVARIDRSRQLDWINLDHHGRWFQQMIWENPYLRARMQRNHAIPLALNRLFVPQHRCEVCMSM